MDAVLLVLPLVGFAAVIGVMAFFIVRSQDPSRAPHYRRIGFWVLRIGAAWFVLGAAVGGGITALRGMASAGGQLTIILISIAVAAALYGLSNRLR